MSKTKIKKLFAILAITTLYVNSTYAATQIGTWSVVWTTSFDNPVNWDGNIPWVATWTVSGIVITAKVLPTLNMVISTGSIDLGTLNAASYSTGSLNIEIWTNAANWATVSATSTNGWLSSASNGSIINDTTTDGIAESYKFSSALDAASDSSVAWYTQTANLDSEVDNTTSSYTIYSTNKPESSSWINDVTFLVSAKIDEQTPAGTDYTDTVTITAVWNF